MAIIIPEEVRNILKDFESKPIFEERELYLALKKSFPKGEISQDLRNAWWAEFEAFHFMEDPDGTYEEWGTVFGPVTKLENNNGLSLYIPDIKDVTIEIFEYWKLRAKEVKHPICQARYADLVWDFSKKVTGKRVSVDFARIAINAYLKAAESVNEETQMLARKYVERALSLSLELKDKKQVETVKQAFFSLYDRILKPSASGTWKFLFDFLYENKKVFLTDEERNKIIQSLENILQICSDPSNKDNFCHYVAQEAAERLVKHYKKLNDQNEIKRVVVKAGLAVEFISQ